MPTFPPHRYYYLHNFRRAMDWIAERHADLLGPEESGFLSRFAALPQPAQALAVRLLMRKGPYFRSGKLAYEEIADIPGAASLLAEAGWLDADPLLDLPTLFKLHTRAELAHMDAAGAFDAAADAPDAPNTPDTSSATRLRKAEWMQALMQAAQHAEPRRYGQWRPGAHESVWQLTAGPLCDRLRLLFFGNLHQDWSEFVLADLGIFQYEPVAFDADARAFRERADVDAYLRLHACREALDGEDPAFDALIADAAACETGNPWLRQRRDKVLLRIGQACERRHLWDTALRAYAASAYPGARHRRMRVLERQERHADALALAQAAARSPESEEESQRLARMLPRLLRRNGLAAPRPPARPAPVLEWLELPFPEDGRRVEFAVLEHLSTPGSAVWYVENTLVNALFGLLCWDAVFAPLPGAFFHPFQRGPADLDAPDFAARRRPMLQACLDLLDDGPAYRDAILRRYRDKQGRQSPFVAWDALTPELLAAALDGIPAAHLRRMFERLLANPRVNRSGLPDLIRFWPAERRYELVEVKGPGDRLQDNQLRWLAYCAEHGIPVRVCHVRWQEPPPAALRASPQGTAPVDAPGHEQVPSCQPPMSRPA